MLYGVGLYMSIFYIAINFCGNYIKWDEKYPFMLSLCFGSLRKKENTSGVRQWIYGSVFTKICDSYIVCFTHPLILNTEVIAHCRNWLKQLVLFVNTGTRGLILFLSMRL